MGEDCRSWLSHSHGDWQLPKLNSVDDDPLDLELGLGQPSGASGFTGSNANLISTTKPSPPHTQAGENKPHGWFYCFPRYRQAFVPLPNSGIMKRLPSTYEDIRQISAHDARPNSGQKRFIVFDRSADQKRLFVSSFAACPPIRPPPPPWSPATYEACNLSSEHPGIEAPHSHVLPLGDVNESRRADAGSELHEDTEELNALLYSDDDDSEEDEEKSTGHSPGAMSNHYNSEWIDEGTADTCFKRQKLNDGGYADSEKPDRYVEFNDYADDAESSCADSLNARPDKMCSFAGDRRMRNKKIRETVRVLRSIIPRGKCDSAVVVLDEAIQYLKSLKCKAKSLGFNQE